MNFRLHTDLQHSFGQLGIMSEVTCIVETESEIRFGPSREDFKIFEVMYPIMFFLTLLRFWKDCTKFVGSCFLVASSDTTLTL